MYCGVCGHPLDETEQVPFCPSCGTPIDWQAVQPPPAAQDDPPEAQPAPPQQADRRAARPAPAAPKGGKNKTLRTVLTALIAVLAVGAVLMAVLIILELRQTDKAVSGGTAPEETVLDGAASGETVPGGADPAAATQAGEQTLPGKDPAEQFREAVTLVDVSSFPDFSGSGYVATFVGDLSNDGTPEYIAVYFSFEDTTETVDVHLYQMADGEPVLADQMDEPITAAMGGNGTVSVCVFYDANGLYLFRSYAFFGGDRWGGEYIRFSVADGELVEDYHFTEHQFPRYNQLDLTDSVSGETYASEEEMDAVMQEKGFTSHIHNMEQDREDGHIFTLYHNYNFNEGGDTGYIHVYQTP